MRNTKSTDWLSDHLHDEEIRIIDCRFHLGDPKQGLNDYICQHIPGAIFFDLEKDLSAEIDTHGGRHPLPRIDELVEKLSTVGIGPDTNVIAYDDQGGAFAARFWWLLRYLGHEKVYVLDGGYSKWKEADLPVTDEIPSFKRREFEFKLQISMVVSMKEVLYSLENPSVTILDSREEARYLGIQEPIDKVAGHIPSAVNFFWKNILSSDGKLKSGKELEEHYASLVEKENSIIVYCGSGVTACPNVLALDEAGYTNVKLYPGSWSDWISYESNPISKKAGQ